jgi:thymidylate synthase (FAD)
MASINQVSARYSVMKDEFYFPELNNVRAASSKNKQVSEGAISVEIAQEFLDSLEHTCSDAYTSYQGHLDQGIGREQARMQLPQNLYSELYWTIDLHNLLHFLALRCHHHAQQEIQVYGNAILDLIKPIVPWTVDAWEDYHPMRGAITLTRLEIIALRLSLESGSNKIQPLQSENKREQAEWEEKAKVLGLG